MNLQELEFERMEESSFNLFDGKQVVGDLKANPDLWLGVIMGDISADNLIPLREIQNNHWCLDTLYILCLKDKAEELKKLVSKWNADEVHWLGGIQSKISDYSGRSENYKVLELWWD